MSVPTTKGVANFKRRTWDKAEYTKLALEREDKERSGQRDPGGKDDLEAAGAVETKFGRFQFADVAAERPSGSTKAFLDVARARGELDLDKHVGQVEKVAGGATRAGFHCDLCDRTFQDSSALVDHLNSREHQSRLGYSMHIAQSSKADVLAKLKGHMKQATLAPARAKKAAAASSKPLSMEERIALAQKELEKAEEAKRAKRRKGKNSNPVEGDEDKEEEKQQPQDSPDAEAPKHEDEMAKSLGFSSFGN